MSGPGAHKRGGLASPGPSRRLGVAAVGLASAVLLWAVLSAADDRPDAGRGGVLKVPRSRSTLSMKPAAGATMPSRFGMLTSRRWTHGQPFERSVLRPVPNVARGLEPQPRRQHPMAVAVSADGTRVYVALHGTELLPGSRVAVYDLRAGRVVRHITLRKAAGQAPATSPYGMKLHPDGRHLLVTSRFANFATVIDTATDKVTAEVPLDYYSQGIQLSKNGRRAYVTNRYLDQVLTVEIAPAGKKGGRAPPGASMLVRGGMDTVAFFAPGGIHAILRRRCGSCHDHRWPGGFYAGADSRQALSAALQNVVPGDVAASRLLGAPLGQRHGGYADARPRFQGHAGGKVIFTDPKADADYRKLEAWVKTARPGPGIPVSNRRSKPDSMALSSDGRYLYVGNTGTQDVSIVDTRLGREVGGIYVQNAVNGLAIHHSPKTGRDYLIIATMGIGYGVARERDPYGAESWDRKNPATHYSAWRDCKTGRMLPRKKQAVLGPLDAADGTAEIKFRDLQNDLVFVDTSRLKIPKERGPGGLNYLLLAHRYQAHKGWVRYTSDTAESTAGDIKGDIPPDLMRVQGALPADLAVVGDTLYVVMSGSNLVQQWRIDVGAAEPSDYLVPLRTFATGLNPRRLAMGPANTPAAGKLFVTNFLGGTLSIIDVQTGASREVVIDPSVTRRPVPDSNAERGELMVRLSLFSSDGDTSCTHCHTRDMGDGRPWGVSQVMGQEFIKPGDTIGQFVIGGTMSPPQMRNLLAIQPFFFEGVLSVFEPRSMIMEHTPSDDFSHENPGGDFTHLMAHYHMQGVNDIQAKMDSGTGFSSDLEERREAMFKALTMRHFGKAVTLRDFVRFIGEWQIHEPRLLPNPYDQTQVSVLRGKALFSDPQVGCVSCHPPPAFAKKDFPAQKNRQQAMVPQVMFTPRDGAFTLIGMNRLDYLNGTLRDLEPWDAGRCEERQGQLTTFPLRGIWDRPPTFLHSGIARNMREVIATPGHRALRRFTYEPLIGGNPERPRRMEVGFNQTYIVPQRSHKTRMHDLSRARVGLDTHGGTMHLRARQIDDLVNFVNSIQ